jgi:hypothetical protein
MEEMLLASRTIFSHLDSPRMSLLILGNCVIPPFTLNTCQHNRFPRHCNGSLVHTHGKYQASAACTVRIWGDLRGATPDSSLPLNLSRYIRGSPCCQGLDCTFLKHTTWTGKCFCLSVFQSIFSPLKKKVFRGRMPCARTPIQPKWCAYGRTACAPLDSGFRRNDVLLYGQPLWLPCRRLP